MSSETNDSIIYGLEELKLLKKYCVPDTATSIWQLITTFVPFFSLWFLAYLSLDYSYLLTLAITLLNAGFTARIFIIQHDCGHGSFLKSKKIQNIIGCFCSLFTLIPYHYWRKVHAIHHATLGNLDNRSPGELPILTVREYLNSAESEKKKYRIIRHPLMIMLIIPSLLFFIQFRAPRNSPEFSKKEKYTVYITDLALLSVILFAGSLLGFKEFFYVQFPLSLMVSTIAVWLFYIQHQYEDTYWKNEKELDFYEASLQGSSYFKIPKIFNWFTGNVGFHHIHHLSPKIPNYLLEKCHKENSQFERVPTLTFWESFKTLSLALWDEDKKKLISFKSLEQEVIKNNQNHSLKTI